MARTGVERPSKIVKAIKTANPSVVIPWEDFVQAIPSLLFNVLGRDMAVSDPVHTRALKATNSPT